MTYLSLKRKYTQRPRGLREKVIYEEHEACMGHGCDDSDCYDGQTETLEDVHEWDLYKDR